MSRMFEKRIIAAELRADEQRPRRVSGHAAVFESDSEPIGGRFIERIARGAFAKTIQEGDQRAFWNHNDDIPLGRKKAGTLNLTEDAVGLWFELDLPESPAGENAYQAIKRGDVSQMSFGFETIQDKWEKPAEGLRRRTLQEVKLFEVSPVSFPAYTATDIDARAIMESRGIRPEDITRDEQTEETQTPDDPPDSRSGQSEEHHEEPTDAALVEVIMRKRELLTRRSI